MLINLQCIRYFLRNSSIGSRQGKEIYLLTILSIQKEISHDIYLSLFSFVETNSFITINVGILLLWHLFESIYNSNAVSCIDPAGHHTCKWIETLILAYIATHNEHNALWMLISTGYYCSLITLREPIRGWRTNSRRWVTAAGRPALKDRLLPELKADFQK